MEVRGVWSGECFFLLPLFTLFPWWTSGGSATWLRLGPNPHLHTVVLGCDGDGERDTYWERDTEEVWRRIVEMSKASPDALVPYNIPIPLLTEGCCNSEGTQSWFLAWDPISAPYKIGGYGGNAIQTWNMALSSYPAQPYWCFLSLSLLSQNEVFQGRSYWQIKKTYPIS